MVIERNKDQIIIKISDSIKDRDLKALTDYVSYIEAIANSHATQDQIDDIAKEVNSSWWKVNKDGLLAS